MKLSLYLQGQCSVNVCIYRQFNTNGRDNNGHDCASLKRFKLYFFTVILSLSTVKSLFEIILRHTTISLIVYFPFSTNRKISKAKHFDKMKKKNKLTSILIKIL